MLSSPLWIFQSELVKTEVDCRSIHSYIIMKIHPWYRPLATPDTIHRLSTPDITHPLSTLDKTHPQATPDTTHPLFTPDITQLESTPDITNPSSAPDINYRWPTPDVTYSLSFRDMTHPSSAPDIMCSSLISCTQSIDPLWQADKTIFTLQLFGSPLPILLTLPMSNNLQTAAVFTLSESKLKVFAVLFAVNLFNSVN